MLSFWLGLSFYIHLGMRYAHLQTWDNHIYTRHIHIITTIHIPKDGHSQKMENQNVSPPIIPRNWNINWTHVPGPNFCRSQKTTPGRLLSRCGSTADLCGWQAICGTARVMRWQCTALDLLACETLIIHRKFLNSKSLQRWKISKCQSNIAPDNNVFPLLRKRTAYQNA